MPPALRKLLEGARLKYAQKGQVLLYAGDQPIEVLLIKEGVVKLNSIDEQGNEKILHLLRTPMIVPLAFFSRPEIATRWYYTTLTDCELYVLRREELEHLMETDAWTMRFLINNFSEEVHEILTRLDSLGKSDGSSKLVIALRYLGVCHGVKARGGWWRIPFPVNHQLLADMIGVSRETVSLTMKILSDDKIVRNPRLAQLEINLERMKTYGQGTA
jgi:CRP-like cAMP-binding protein